MNLTEKHAPKNWDEIIGQEDIVASIRIIVERKGENCPNLMFIGPPGSGKTSTANVIKKVLRKKLESLSMSGVPFREFNASDFRGIDFVRDEIKQQSQYKIFQIFFLDESDNMTSTAQHALRRIMERAPTTLFILSGNNEDGFIDALKSRCSVFRFEKISKDAILKRLYEVLKAEGIEVSQDATVRLALDILATQSNGDMRAALNNLEKIIDIDDRITPNSISLFKPGKVAEVDLSDLEGMSAERVQKRLAKLQEEGGSE